MNCCICYDDILDLPFRSEKCGCNLVYHLNCYNLMKTKNNIDCAYCRNRIIDVIQRNDLNDRLFNFIFSLPPIIGLPLWFMISWLFVLIVFPFVFPKEIYNLKVAIISYIVYVYILYLIVSNIYEGNL